MSTKTRTRRNRKPKTSRPQNHPTVVDLRHPLPTRPITGPRSTLETAEARAALAAAWCRLPIPVLAWHATTPSAVNAHLSDGTLLVHTGREIADAGDRFTAWTPCPGGAHHAATVTDHASLTAARRHAAHCTSPHTSDDATTALTRGVQTPPTRDPAPVRNLADAFRHDAERTQELDLTALRAAADNEQPKDHSHD
ncbi:hypothetical protein ACPB9J_33310 [Streptomyces lavendulocolor]|uniref:hypothetical protein n=1 Tax=Streptomyces lavendulocolor TaxID=67316 RepID=UPI003C2F91C2